MGLFKGFLLGIPIGIYYGEKGLPFPVSYQRRMGNSWGYIKVDFEVFDALQKDINRIISRNPAE